MATKMAGKKRRVKPTLTPEEARETLGRRHRRWRRLNDAAVNLAAKMKPVKKDIRGCLAVLPESSCEAAGVKSQLVETMTVDKKDERNIELLRGVLSKADFEKVCPRVIDVTEAYTFAEAVVDSLRGRTSTRCEIDLIQEPVGKGA